MNGKKKKKNNLHMRTYLCMRQWNDDGHGKRGIDSRVVWVSGYYSFC